MSKMFTRQLLAALIIAIVVGFALPSATMAAPRSHKAEVVQEFEWIRQGQVGIVRVTGANIQTVVADFVEHRFQFFPDPRNRDIRPAPVQAWVGLITAEMTTTIAFHPITIRVQYNDGHAEVIEQQIRVAHGEFGRQDINLPGSMLELLEPEVNEEEYETLAVHNTPFRPERDWQREGFVMPTYNYVISYFGAWRFFNGLQRTYRHTGIDLPAFRGDPQFAVADGRVAWIGKMAIRGNYILLDHGWGIFTGYAHADSVAVEIGDEIAQGDVIGTVGNNGRSTGPHIHFEMTVNGIWVNPLAVVPLLNELKTE
jgi:hypothetical protein